MTDLCNIHGAVVDSACPSCQQDIGNTMFRALSEPVFYTLAGKDAVPCDTIIILPVEQRRVGLTDISGHCVSTVFVGWYNCIFETVVFNLAGANVFEVRYDTWAEAEEGHGIVCNLLENKLRENPVAMITRESLIEGKHDSD